MLPATLALRSDQKFPRTVRKGRPQPGMLAGAYQGCFRYEVTMYCVANPCCVRRSKNRYLIFSIGAQKAHANSARGSDLVCKGGSARPNHFPGRAGLGCQEHNAVVHRE
jgi:hypothetical protein